MIKKSCENERAKKNMRKLDINIKIERVERKFAARLYFLQYFMNRRRQLWIIGGIGWHTQKIVCSLAKKKSPGSYNKR